MWAVSMLVFFFFKQKTAYEISTRDWSSDVCSSDLLVGRGGRVVHDRVVGGGVVDRRGRRGVVRSEERRGGKEGRSRWSPHHLKKKCIRSCNDFSICPGRLRWAALPCEC